MFDHTAVLPKKWNRKEKMSGGNKTSEELLWYWFVVEALCPCLARQGMLVAFHSSPNLR